MGFSEIFSLIVSVVAVEEEEEEEERARGKTLESLLQKSKEWRLKSNHSFLN